MKWAAGEQVFQFLSDHDAGSNIDLSRTPSSESCHRLKRSLSITWRSIGPANTRGVTVTSPLGLSSTKFTERPRNLPQHPTRQKSFQLPRPHRVLKLPNRLRLNLANALARHLEDAAHFFQRIGVAVADAV